MAYIQFKLFREDISHNYYQNPYTGELGYSYKTEEAVEEEIKGRVREDDFYFFDDYKPTKDWVTQKEKYFLQMAEKKRKLLQS